jgi:hypothetical protein
MIKVDRYLTRARVPVTVVFREGEYFLVTFVLGLSPNSHKRLFLNPANFTGFKILKI